MATLLMAVATAGSSSSAGSAATSPVSGVSSSPSSPSEEAAAGASAAASSRQRKLSAAAREFNPTGAMQYPTASSGVVSPVEASTRDEFLQADDAEDDDELDAFISSVVGADAASPGALLPPTKKTDTARLQEARRRRVEYLFSNQHLWMDAGMQEEMKRDATHSGYVALQYLCGLPTIQQLGAPTAAELAGALQSSEKLSLSPDSRQVRRVVPLQPYDAYKDSNRTIFIDRLPPGSTVPSVKKLFSRFGRVTYVLRADHILGATGMNADEKGKLTPHASPKLRPRSLSQADIGTGRMSPSVARKLSSAGLVGTPGQSPSLSGLSAPLSHLSPAQRNRVIAATTPIDSPDCFSAAFIQFEKPACCKKAVSHIVAYNKQLKAQTPKGSPRVPGARRGSHGGIPTLPAAAMGGSGHALMSLPGDQLPQVTPPRSRSIKISSQTASPILSPKASPILSPPRANAGQGSMSDLPPAHPMHTVSPPPPRHALSPPPSASPAQPTSTTASAKKRAQSVTAPPPQGMPKMGGLDSPAFTSTHEQEGGGGLPDLSLEHGSSSMPTAANPAVAVVAPLPESFIGMFVMPKISYLKSLKTRPGEQQPGGRKGASALNSPALMPITVVAENKDEGKQQAEKKQQQQQQQNQQKREKAVSPLAPLALGQTAAGAALASVGAPEKVVKLSAAAPVFQPSSIATPVLVPVIAPAALKPTVTSASPPMRAQKGNWRSDGSTPLLHATSGHAPPTVDADFAGFALGAAATASPALGPQAAPGEEAAKKKKPKKAKAEVDEGKTEGASTHLSSPSLSSLSPPPVSEKARFSLTATRRNSLGVVPENARSVVSRFALGPTSADAIGFSAGRGRPATAGPAAAAAALPPMGSGKPIV